MKIKITSSHIVDGMGPVAEGAVLEVPEYEARRKIAMGYAVAVDVLPPEKGEVRFDDTAIKPTKKK